MKHLILHTEISSFLLPFLVFTLFSDTSIHRGILNFKTQRVDIQRKFPNEANKLFLPNFKTCFSQFSFFHWGKR